MLQRSRVNKTTTCYAFLPPGNFREIAWSRLFRLSSVCFRALSSSFCRFLSNSVITLLRYSSKPCIPSPRTLKPPLPSTSHSVACVDVMSRASWDTKMKPPSYRRKAEIISSTDSMSRWLVGSSNIKISGRLHVRSANCTRAFWPPDSSLIGRVCACVGKPNCPKLLWACSFFSMPAPKRRTSGCVRSSTGLRVSLSPSSSKCWEYRPIDKPFEWLTSPWLGQSIFESKLRRVLLPAPFLPTTAMRSHALMRKLSFGPRSHGAFPFQLKLMS
mmetsp:Transcript_56769/g.143930  ORF Transcript_56769/g.143930 Transcript_56769/m.143930 type:complete len:272 (-) Transcript_56769:1389-2204(-)